MQPQQSLKQLVTQTISDGTRLLRAQVNLTTTELSETTKTIGKISLLGLIAVSLISMGGIFVLISIAICLGCIGSPHLGRLPDRGGSSFPRYRNPGCSH